jgi:DNA recombination protein RmuC
MQVLLFVTGLVLGGVAGGFIIRYAIRSKMYFEFSERFNELEGKARYAEGHADQLKTQLMQAEGSLERVRAELETERGQHVAMSTKLDETGRHLEEQKELVSLMRNEMIETFKAHAATALETSNKNFLQLAQENLGRIVEQTKGKLGEHHAAMEGIIRPLQDVLNRYELELKNVEKHRNEHYGSLAESIQALSRMNEQLQKETSSLVTTLRKPQVSGSWGQMSLKRAAELAGMAPHCDFYEEVSVNVEGGRLRPDMVVRLPNGRTIVIDAKAPVDAYLNAVSALSEEEKKKAISGYISQVRNHMNSLGLKSYWDQFETAPEMVIMYLPGESFFSAALENDPKLIEDGTIRKVILATPTTLIALLRAVAFGWQQEQIAKGAQEINRLGRELFDRFAVVIEHIGKIGGGLNKSVESYNDAVRSLESRLLPSLRRFKELGITSPKDIENSMESISLTAKETKHLCVE